MARKEVNILSQKSISDAQEMLSQLSDYLSSNKTIEELTELAYDEVIKNVSEYSQEHLYSIKSEVSGDTGKVYTNDAVLIYNEYGTGVVGAQNPHPDLDGWKYDVNEHGEEGWMYFDNGEWHWTKGLPARQGFYDARETMKDIAGNKVNLAIEKIFTKYTK